MKQHISFLSTRRTMVYVFVMVLIGVGYYLWRGANTDSSTDMALIVQRVEKGIVSTGIQASGKIEAAEILDLNVYKLENRLDAVSVANGVHVTTGQLLYAFDESDATVDIADSALSVRAAQLALAEQKKIAQDPNTVTRALRQEIADLSADILQSEKDLVTTRRTYLNKDRAAEPTTSRYTQQVGRTAPTIGGLYVHDEQGVYVITVYASGEKSGYSFRYTGLESGVSPVYLGASAPLGTRGLTITFPTTATQITARDEWMVAVPNLYADDYRATTDEYTKTITNLTNKIAADKVTRANKETELAKEERGDTTTQRNLEVESAALAIEKARVNLSRGIDTRDERRIIAPFSGTIEGAENVVVGATPTKDGSDSIDFGYLISDEFIATFSLGASEVERVSVGQSVQVSLATSPGALPLAGVVTEVSSLPDSSTVPQYKVRARLVVASSTQRALRDGMLADIEITQEERTNVVRVPVSALTYRDGGVYVRVLEQPSEEELAMLAERGVVRRPATAPGGVERRVSVGLRGTYYAEITEGLTEGEYLLVASTGVQGTTDESVVQDVRGFRPGGNRSSGTQTTGSSNTNTAPSRE
jgi:multidrug resistance efflux pump